MIEIFTSFVAFLGAYGVELGGGAALLAIVGFFWSPFRRLFQPKPEPTETNRPTAILTPKEAAGHDVAYFINVQKALKAELEAEFANAHAEEKDVLRARISELQSQLQNPDDALKVAQGRVAELEARLTRLGNSIGGDRLTEARAALARFDYSVADEIFADIEARQEMAVKDAARAAFGRGEVAEAEIRWADAAEHYERAARLDPDFDGLGKASKFARHP